VIAVWMSLCRVGGWGVIAVRMSLFRVKRVGSDCSVDESVRMSLFRVKRVGSDCSVDESM